MQRDQEEACLDLTYLMEELLFGLAHFLSLASMHVKRVLGHINRFAPGIVQCVEYPLVGDGELIHRKVVEVVCVPRLVALAKQDDRLADEDAPFRFFRSSVHQLVTVGLQNR